MAPEAAELRDLKNSVGDFEVDVQSVRDYFAVFQVHGALREFDEHHEFQKEWPLKASKEVRLCGDKHKVRAVRIPSLRGRDEKAFELHVPTPDAG